YRLLNGLHGVVGVYLRCRAGLPAQADIADAAGAGDAFRCDVEAVGAAGFDIVQVIAADDLPDIEGGHFTGAATGSVCLRRPGVVIRALLGCVAAAQVIVGRCRRVGSRTRRVYTHPGRQFVHQPDALTAPRYIDAFLEGVHLQGRESHQADAHDEHRHQHLDEGHASLSGLAAVMHRVHIHTQGLHVAALDTVARPEREMVIALPRLCPRSSQIASVTVLPPSLSMPLDRKLMKFSPASSALMVTPSPKGSMSLMRVSLAAS